MRTLRASYMMQPENLIPTLLTPPLSHVYSSATCEKKFLHECTFFSSISSRVNCYKSLVWSSFPFLQLPPPCMYCVASPHIQHSGHKPPSKGSPAVAPHALRRLRKSGKNDITGGSFLRVFNTNCTVSTPNPRSRPSPKHSAAFGLRPSLFLPYVFFL